MKDPNQKLYKACPSCSEKLSNKDISGKARIVCLKCNFVYWSNPKPCTGVIIEKEKRILFLKIKIGSLKGYWCFPGGYLEYDELPEKSIIRETKEETGLDIVIKSLVGVYLIDNDPRGNSIEVVYSAVTRSEKITLSKEHSEYDFFSKRNLPRKIAYKHREAVLDYFQQEENKN